MFDKVLKRVAGEAGKLGLNIGMEALASHPLGAIIMKQIADKTRPGEGADAAAFMIRDAAAAYFSDQAMMEIDSLVLEWAEALQKGERTTAEQAAREVMKEQAQPEKERVADEGARLRHEAELEMVRQQELEERAAQAPPAAQEQPSTLRPAEQLPAAPVDEGTFDPPEIPGTVDEAPVPAVDPNQLSTNFHLKEFLKSATADREGIVNVPANDEIDKNLRALCAAVLQPISDQYSRGVRINSGYRGPALNAAVGGSPTSQHCKGEAADIEIINRAGDLPVSNFVLAQFIQDNLPFDQLILENYTRGKPNSGWVHVSYSRLKTKQRRQAMTATFENGRPKYSAGLNA